MIHVQCPHCRVWLDLEEPGYAASARCGHCGRAFDPDAVSAAATVIDVHAEPVGEAPQPETRYEPAPGSGSLEEYSEPSGPRGPIRYFQTRQIYVNDNPGCCCGVGCFGMLLLFWMMLQSVMLLF